MVMICTNFFWMDGWMVPIDKSRTTKKPKTKTLEFFLFLHFTHNSLRYTYTLFISLTIRMIESNGKEIVTQNCGLLRI